MKTLDVCGKVPRPEDKIDGNKKYFYPVVGKAFMEEDGTRIDIKLESIPINWNGQLTIFLNPKVDPND